MGCRIAQRVTYPKWNRSYTPEKIISARSPQNDVLPLTVSVDTNGSAYWRGIDFILSERLAIDGFLHETPDVLHAERGGIDRVLRGLWDRGFFRDK